MDAHEQTWEVPSEWEGPAEDVIEVRYPPDDPSEMTTRGFWEEFAAMAFLGLYFAATGPLLVVVGARLMSCESAGGARAGLTRAVVDARADGSSSREHEDA